MVQEWSAREAEPSGATALPFLPSSHSLVHGRSDGPKAAEVSKFREK